MNKDKKIEGQYTDEEFKQMCKDAGFMRHHVNYPEGTAWIMYGKSTINYYRQMTDGSWLNHDCKTR